TVVAGVEVEHEIGQRALEPGPETVIHRKPRSRDFGGSLKIQDAERRAQVPVSLGFEVELPRLAPASYLLVVLGPTAHRDACGRYVGNVLQELAKAGLGGLDLGVETFDFLLELLHLGDQR